VQTEEQSENPLIKSSGKMSAEGFAIDCIEINYPFAFALESGATITVNNNDETEIALYSEEDYVVDLVYPIEAVDQDGNSLTINSADELAETFIECIPEDGWGEFEDLGFPAFDFEGLCVNIVYPLTLQSDDGETTTVNNEQEFANALASEFYYFSFPITVVDQEGNTLEMENDKALMNALFDCVDYNYYYEHSDCPFDFDFCFEIVYPAGLVDEAGNITNVDNADDLYNLIFSGQIVDFVYPITLISEDGTTEEVGDANAMNELIDDCFDYSYGHYPPFYYYDFCFAIDYPVDFTDATGNTQTANNEDELFELIYSGQVIDFIYPITIILEDSITTPVNDQNELSNIISDCPYQGYEADYEEYEGAYEDYEGEYDLDVQGFFDLLFILESFCLDINLPITITVDNEEITINDAAEFEASIIEIFSSDVPQEIEINFPITATLNSDGSVITINEEADLLNYIYDCP